MKAMLNHNMIAKLIEEKDRPILMYLADVKYTLHDEGYGYDLIFTFEANNGYFENTVLKKSFFMSKQNVIEKCEGTEIKWA